MGLNTPNNSAVLSFAILKFFIIFQSQVFKRTSVRFKSLYLYNMIWKQIRRTKWWEGLMLAQLGGQSDHYWARFSHDTRRASPQNKSHKHQGDVSKQGMQRSEANEFSLFVSFSHQTSGLVFTASHLTRPECTKGRVWRCWCICHRNTEASLKCSGLLIWNKLKRLDYFILFVVAT